MASSYKKKVRAKSFHVGELIWKSAMLLAHLGSCSLTDRLFMMDNVDEVSDKRLQDLKEIEKDKFRVARAYNKKVRAKKFQVGELVWKTILPLGTKNNKFGKWSPSWEELYKIIKVIFGNSYMVEMM